MNLLMTMMMVGSLAPAGGSLVGIAVASTALAAAILLAASPLPALWDRLAAWWTADLRVTAEGLGYGSAQITAGLRGWAIFLASVPAVIGPVSGLYILVPAAMGLAVYAPRWILQGLIARRCHTFRDQLVPACSAIANKGRANMPLQRAINETAAESPEPIHSVLSRIDHSLACGRTLREAVSEARDALRIDSFGLFASVIMACQGPGGSYPQALDSLAAAFREELRLENVLATQTASGRLALWTMGAFPFLFLSVHRLLDPEGTRLVFSTLVGQITLLVVASITYVSVMMARSVLKVIQ